jgi:hypothetical protein
MSKYLFLLIASIFAVGCATAKMQWVSTINIKPSEVPVSKEFLDRIRSNWYYNTNTKCYGINVGFKSYLANGLYEGCKETLKLDTQQFIRIFGQPDFVFKDKFFHTQYRFFYTYIDLNTRAKLGFSYAANSRIDVYSGGFEDKKISFIGEGDIDEFGFYEQKFNSHEVSSIYKIAILGCCKTESEETEFRNTKVKEAMHNYYFFNKKAGHYVHIDGLPLPSSCASKAEVLRLFSKPSKIEANGDLIYYLSLPNHYGNRNFIKWSPLPDGKYAMEEKIDR